MSPLKVFSKESKKDESKIRVLYKYKILIFFSNHFFFKNLKNGWSAMDMKGPEKERVS
jgi:hypothetical protein